MFRVGNLILTINIMWENTTVYYAFNTINSHTHGHNYVKVYFRI